LYKFRYSARFEDIGSENELCSIFIGSSNAEPAINRNEIMEWKYIPIHTISTEIEQNPDIYSPWFKMEWERISNDFFEDIEKIITKNK
jgi:isopentenyl-diphosphate delta-isomerase